MDTTPLSVEDRCKKQFSIEATKDSLPSVKENGESSHDSQMGNYQSDGTTKDVEDEVKEDVVKDGNDSKNCSSVVTETENGSLSPKGDLKDEVGQGKEEEVPMDVDCGGLLPEKKVDNDFEVETSNEVEENKEENCSKIKGDPSDSPNALDDVDTYSNISGEGGMESKEDAVDLRNTKLVNGDVIDSQDVKEDSSEVENNCGELSEACSEIIDEDKITDSSEPKADLGTGKGENKVKAVCDEDYCIPAENKFDNTTCDLLVFDLKEKDKSEELDGVSLEVISDDKKETSATTKSGYIQPVFEDITEDEDSDDEQFENIELELDDLIDTPDASLNSSGNSKGSGTLNSTLSPKGDTEIKSSILSTDVKNSSDSSGSVMKNVENVNGATIVKTESEAQNHRSSENVDPTEVGDNRMKSVEKPIMMRKKSTARKSGKPVSQLESAPLKKINMYPITDVTMNISEVEEALRFDLDQAKKVKKSESFCPSMASTVDPSQGNTYKVISVTKSNQHSMIATKKKRKKRGYDLPGCHKKKKKHKLSDDVASVGASSIDSISLSESDLMESDSISSCGSSNISTSLSELQSSREFSSCTRINSSSIPVSSSLPPSSTSSSVSSSLSSSFPTSSVSSTASSKSTTKLGINNKAGSNKIKSVLDMLHERNRKKAANDTQSRPFTTSNTTTTTTIMVSPPESKPIVEGLKRKGTPRKRRDDVICVSDDDEDNSEVGLQPKGKKNSTDHHTEVINTTTTSMVPAKIQNLNNIANTSSGPAPVVMMVAQHPSTTPGLRSLLPRNMLVSATPVSGAAMGVAMVRPENVQAMAVTASSGGNILTQLPLVSSLPVGMKAVSMANLPAGISTIPFTSLPPGSTIFTAVQGGIQAGVGTSLPPGATFVNVTPPKSAVNATNNNSSKYSPKSHHPNSLLSSSGKSSSKSKHHSILPSPQQKSSSAQQQTPVNSEALRALLVGKPYSVAHQNITPSSASSVLFSSPLSSSLTVSSSISLSTPSSLINSSPVVFQMLTSKTSPTNSSLATGATLVPLQPANFAAASSTPSHHKKILPHQSKSSSSSNKLSALHSYSSIKPIHQSSIMPPNGVSCLTPPKTPDTDSSSEVAVAASLTRPVGGQFEENDVIPLCCCKINVPSFNKMLTGVTYCQALDSVDSKVLGCCNKVTSSQLVRPGVKIPFMAVCEVHRKRLAQHQCCPGCGHFCSQGKFQQCRKEGTSSIHNFHKQCVFYRGGKHFCPHCGEETSLCEVELKLNEDGNATSKLAGKAAKKDIEKKTSARLSAAGSKKSKSTKGNNKTLTLPNKKSVDPSVLNSGPDLATLTRLCKCMGEDRPKKYRTLAKDLYSPASEGDMEKVFYLLADGLDPNVRSEENDDQTPLHVAAISGSVGTVFILVQFGAEIHAQDRSLQTPLMCAAENGNVKVVQYLLKAGAKVEDRGEDGMTGLHYAAKAGHLDVIKLLLSTKKLDVNVQDDGGWTPIIWATESMLPDIVRYLIGEGGDPNQKDNEENTGLHWASFSGSVEIAEMLLDLGCELDTPNEHGDRPLHIAARQDHYDIVVHLLAKGANVDVRNHKNETPVDACVNKTGQVSMALKVNQQLRGLATYKLIQPERLLDRDITMGREKNPIACVNKEDKELVPTDYLYIMQNVETSPLNINNVITGLQSCRCKDDCSSMYCVCARSSVRCWYDKTGRLTEDFNLLEPPLLFECNRACRCWVNCNNRVVQNGIVCRLQLFRTNGRGWGVRALMDIPKGTFVCEYIGELISDSEADRREDDSYLFDLDNKDGDTYCIDARKYGNVARFINHLCEPNLVPVKVFVEHQDLRFPRICFFSSREIKAYEELGFDYGEKFWIIKWKQFTCACQSDKCKYSKDTIQKTLDDYKLRYPDDETMDQDKA